MPEKKKEEKVIDRLLLFVEWAKKGGMVKSRKVFEENCGLSSNYLYNTQYLTKKSIGSDIIAKIHNAYPMLNLIWLITGKGSMIELQPDDGYKAAYLDLKKKVDDLKKRINKI